MRKIMSLFLVFVFFFIFPGAALANNLYPYVDHSVEVISKETFFDYFGTTYVDSIYYDYSFDNTSTNDLSCVTVDFAMHINNVIYTGYASGYISSITLIDDILWEGPICGYLSVGQYVYPIIIGFAKLNSSNCVQLALSCTIETSETDQVIYISAGDSVITNEIYQTLVDVKYNSDDDTFDTSSNNNKVNSRGLIDKPIVWDDGDAPPTYGTYALEMYHSYPLDENTSVTGGGMSVYFSNVYNCVAVSIHSFCDNVASSHLFPDTITGTSVKSISYRLTRGDYTPESYSLIAGVERFGFEQNNFNVLNTPLSPLFEDILGILSVPTSTISAILGNLSGEVSCSEYTDDCTVTIDFGLTSDVDFDASSRGLPVVFQLLKATDSYEGYSLYNISTSITYFTSVVFLNGVGFPVFYTEHVSEMETSIEVTLK